jgi:8-hydroxy-5-deazaflavin:NADPH oxidoreductase
MRIAIIGAGNVGGTLGRGWTRARHQVNYGVRDPDAKAAALAQRSAQVALPRQAVEWSDVVVLATPWAVTQAVLATLGDFGGRPLLDATNPIGPGLISAVGADTSGGELVQAWAPTARVVKIFNSTGAENLAAPVYGDEATTMFYCGDDAPACGIATKLATDLGFDAISAGPLRNARLLEQLALLWITLAGVQGANRSIAFKMLRRDKPAR